MITFALEYKGYTRMEIIIRFFVWLSQWAKVISYLRIVPYDQWEPGKKLKILLVGYNGARNTGADARVVALADQLKEEFGKDNIELTVMTLNPELTQGYFPDDVHILPFPTFFCWALFRASSAHHVAILCEGSTLTHTFADVLSMFFCQAAGIMKRQGKPCLAYGSDVTLLKPALAKLSQDMCQDTHFIARSQSSLKNLQVMGFKCHLGTDTAWTIKVPEGQDEGYKLLTDQGWNGQSKLIGLAAINPYCWPVQPSFKRWVKALLSGDRSLQYDNIFFFSDSEERRIKYREYLNELAQIIKTYRDEHHAFAVIIGMERLDTQACNDLKEMVGDCAVISSEYTPVFQMLSVLKKLDALVTSRYHAAVLSMSRGIPMVAVSMDNRLDGLFQDYGIADDYLYHVGDKDLSLHVLEAMAKAEARKEEYAQSIKERIEKNCQVLKEMSSFAREWIMHQLNRKNHE